MKKLLFVMLILVLAAPAFAAPKTYDVKNFSAQTFFTDKKVSVDVFKDYDVTMVNFFTTTCVYCMCELDSLGQVKQRMPEGCNIIAVCADAYDFGEALEDVSNVKEDDVGRAHRCPEAVYIMLDAHKAGTVAIVSGEGAAEKASVNVSGGDDVQFTLSARKSRKGERTDQEGEK
jgi:thiol-disulfide isomerase/thioredoxin